jgi:F-type H+-transporting ATPase subunit b
MPVQIPWILEFPQPVTSSQWLIVTVAGFLLVALVFAKLVWPSQIGVHLTQRKAAIVEAREQVEATRKEVETIRADYRSRLESIEDETERRLAEAVEEAEQLRTQILAEAEQQAAAIRKRGEEDLAREQAKVLQVLRTQFINDIIDAAETAVERGTDPAAHKKLVADFAARVGGAS